MNGRGTGRGGLGVGGGESGPHSESDIHLSQLHQLAKMLRVTQETLIKRGVDPSPENMAAYLLQALVQSSTPLQEQQQQQHDYDMELVHQNETDPEPTVYYPIPSKAEDVPERLSRMLEEVYRARGLPLPLSKPGEAMAKRRRRTTDVTEHENMQIDMRWAAEKVVVQDGPEIMKVQDDSEKVKVQDDTDKIIDRIAKARVRNREAQQRFRNRRREKIVGMETDYTVLRDMCRRIEEDNLALEQKAHYLSRIIIMREIILHSLSCEPPEKDSMLYRILGETGFGRTGESTPKNDGKESSSEEEEEGQREEPIEEVMEERPGSSGNLDEIYRIAHSLDDPESFFLYWREWQIEIKHSLAEYDQFKNNETREDVIRKFDKMVKIWAVNSRLYPNNFKVMVADHSMPEEQGSMRWRDIARRVFETMTEDKVQLLNEYWDKFMAKMSDYYSRRVDVAEKLANHQDSIKDHNPDKYCLKNMSNNHLLLGYLIGSLNYLSEKTWITNVRLSSGWTVAIGEWNSCICNALAAPYPPNWVAICKEIVDIGKSTNIVKKNDDMNQ